jgi:hypothetical protein
MEGFNRAQGQTSGIRMRQDFNARFQAWEGRHSASPEEFQSWYGDFVNEHLTSENPEQLGSLLPHVETLTEDAYGTFQRVRGERLMEEAVTTHIGVSAITIDEAFNQALGNPDGVPFTELWADLLAQRDGALATGIPRQRYDQNLFDTIIAKAAEHGDIDILELLDETLPGHTVPLGQQPDFLQDRLGAESRVLRIIANREDEEASAQEERDEEREETIIREVMRFLSDNPTGRIDQRVMDEWAVYDPMALRKLEDVRSTFVTAQSTEDPRAILEVEMHIFEGARRSEIIGMAGPNGPIRSVQTLRRLLGQVDQRVEFSRQMLNAPALQRYREFLMSQLGARRNAFDVYQPRTRPTEEYIAAVRDLEIAAMEWFRDNPNASVLERQSAMDEIGRYIIARVEGDARSLDDPQYGSQEDYLEALGDQERQAPSIPDQQAAERADRLPVTPGYGPPELESPDEQTQRVLNRIPVWDE